MRRTVRTLTLALGLVALLWPTAALADSHLTIEPDTVHPGDSFTVSGQCPTEGTPEEGVAVLAAEGFEGGLLGRVDIGEDGSFSGEVRVNENAPLTSGTVSVPCPDGQTVLEGDLTITADDTDDADDPETAPAPRDGVETGVGGGGSELPGLIAIASGLLLLAAGGLLLRRRSA